ncbi:MAG TPA: hypothetical protein VJ933_11020, partial [Phaeodactylibacter sp.]|nr:hypothetical protein [Phaeodactylibacter sp.]
RLSVALLFYTLSVNQYFLGGDAFGSKLAIYSLNDGLQISTHTPKVNKNGVPARLEKPRKPLVLSE